MLSEKNVSTFDDVTVDRENFRVVKAGRNITLTPRAFDVLVFLMEHSGRVVEKQDLFAQVWKGTVVSDNALTKVIKELRQALDDDANAPRYIETVPRRGYRFIAEIKAKSNEPTQEADTVPQEPSQTTSHPLKNPLVVSAVALALLLLIGAWVMSRQKTVKTAPSMRSIAVLPFKPLNSDSRDESLEMGMAEALITRLSNLKLIVVR